MIGGLYRVENPFNKVMQGMGQASGSLAAMTKEQKTKYQPPPKSIGGAIMSGAGTGYAGYTIGSSIGGMAGGAGAGTGAATGATAGVGSGAAIGAGSGAAAGSAAGPWGAAIGAAVGILAYLLS